MKNLLSKTKRAMVIGAKGTLKGLYADDTLNVAGIVGVYSAIVSKDIKAGIEHGAKAGLCMALSHGVMDVLVDVTNVEEDIEVED